ncbi:Na(+)/H(+) antiporter subunit C [Brevibacterium jeotgali]|uniref:Multisubunit sodium/proton antiporter, MrpC subunit n=1 Tax=Brevibacterium jeotgali TaxID=1262550 RepID=A0A2H1L5C7_9MICO|nr:Na(+)/H(+) antiporter subunit C [Brevibacterium jeotgali]TWB98457.1 multisubunit sodium/proton antiporter MrpC subunit [Brevibacterium jeotgali]SMY12092.1 multisubunit sodium/proton antiporter, MrpC subunit [Brevibacterium jeotgali]
MTPPLVMVIAMGAMYAAGIYLMLDRSLTRVLLGFLLMGNATNLLLLLTGGLPGRPPLTDGEDLSAEGMLDPLPQALILTAIVISFSLTAFLLAMVYRSWRFVRDESLQDDLEDMRVALEATGGSGDEAGTSGEYEDTEFGDEALTPLDDDAPDLDDDGTPDERAALREAHEAASGHDTEEETR